MIKLQMIGNIGDDCTIKEANGNKFGTFSIAHSESYKDKDGNKCEKTTWVNCIVKGDSKVIPFLKKGTKVYVEGKPNLKIYTNKKNEPTIDFTINVNMIELLSKKKDDSSNVQNSTNENPDFSELDSTSGDLPF